MSEQVDTLPNLGPKTARLLEDVGISTVAELRAIGAVQAWRRIKFAHPKRVSLVGLYAIEAALRGCPGTSLSGEERERLRRSAGTDPVNARTGRSPGNRNRS